MKFTIIALILVAAAALLLVACEDFVGPSRWNNEFYYIITGNLVDGQPITLDRPIFVGRTINVNGGNPNEMFILDATVVVRELGPDNTAVLSDTLSFSVYNPTGDLNDMKVGYVDPDSSFIPQAGKTYQVAVYIPEEADSIWARTTVPSHMEVMPDEAFTFDETATYPTLKWDTANIEHPLRIQAQNDEMCYMYFRFYCLEDFASEPQYTIDFMGMDDTPEDEDEYDDMRETAWVSRYQPEQREDQNYYIEDRGYKANIWFYGDTEIDIYSIDENYWQYNYKPEGYRYGGVNNGLGYFGSLSGQKMYTRVIE